MTRILFIGQIPETIDFSDPSLPPGFDAAKIRAGIAVGMAKMAERGWQADECMIAPDQSGLDVLADRLAKATYDCVVIGAGLRLPPKGLVFFESVVNTVREGAPKTPIAFNTSPPDTADAAARRL
jgi:hypothetical protein